MYSEIEVRIEINVIKKRVLWLSTRKAYIQKGEQDPDMRKDPTSQRHV